MLLQEDMPFKWKAIIRHYLLKDVDEDTTLENHIFFMKKEDFSYETYRQLKAKFKLSVFNGDAGKKRTKSGYVSREYKIEEIVSNDRLHEIMDTLLSFAV